MRSRAKRATTSAWRCCSSISTTSRSINDELGHAVGDELLVGVARRLRGCLRSADTVARLGGDEFGVLLEHVAGPNEVVQAAERILAAFDEPFSSTASRIAVT